MLFVAVENFWHVSLLFVAVENFEQVQKKDAELLSLLQEIVHYMKLDIQSLKAEIKKNGDVSLTFTFKL